MPGNWSEFLSPADVQAIHDTSIKLLANVGVRFHQDEALAILKGHGARVDGRTVFFERRAGHGCRERGSGAVYAPRPQPWAQRDRGGGEPVFAPGYGAPFVADLDVGRRRATMQDYDDLARLAHALPNQDLVGYLMVGPQDVPAHLAHLKMLYANVTHSDKPFIGSIEGKSGARHTMEMASILFGEAVRERAVRARKRWQELLAEHRDPPLDETTARQLRAFVEERDSRA